MAIQKKLLLCDDDPDILEVTSLLFVMENYSVRTLKHLGELVSVIEEFHPDVILMDLRIPDVGGAKATQILKADPDFKNIPIIIYSADTEVKEIAKQIKADSYFLKPFDIEELLEEVSNLLHKSNGVRSNGKERVKE